MAERPRIYDHILMSSRDGEPVGRARVGGHFGRPDLGLSYLLAARHVMVAAEAENRLREVAIPAAYLQRHALEVAVKDLIALAASIEHDLAWARRLRADPNAEAPPQRVVPREHDFQRLVDALDQALEAIGFERAPAAIRIMTSSLRDRDEFHPPLTRADGTRLRYARATDGTESFPNSEVIHVRETQEALERLFDECLVYRPDEPNTFIADLSDAAEAAWQELLGIAPHEVLFPE